MNDLGISSADNRKLVGTYNPNTYTALDAAVCFIILLVAEFAASRVFIMLFNSYKEAHETFDFYVVQILSLLVSQSLIFAIGFLFSKIRRVSYLSGGGFTFKFDIVNILFAMLLTLGLYLLLSGVHMQFADDTYRIFYDVDYETYAERYEEYVIEHTDENNSLFAFIYVFVLVPIVPAIVEEGLFRGVIMRGLKQFGTVFAIVVSSLAFALMHGNLQQLVLQFFFGLLASSLVILTKNYLLGVLMHLTNNLMSTILAALSEFAEYVSTGTVAAAVIDAVFIMIGVAFMTVSVIYFINLLLSKNKRKVLGQGDKTDYYDEKKYAVIVTDKLDESGEPILEKIVWNGVDAGQFTYAGAVCYVKNKRIKLNKPSNATLSKILIFISLGLAVALIFIDMFI